MITTLQLHSYYTYPLLLIILLIRLLSNKMRHSRFLESTSLPPLSPPYAQILKNLSLPALLCSPINVCHQQALCLFPATPYVRVRAVHSCYRSCLSLSLYLSHSPHLPQFAYLLKPPETSVRMRFGGVSMWPLALRGGNIVLATPRLQPSLRPPSLKGPPVGES